ncbi:unnamed protein product [Rhizophagus irregularis]|nr:unnamed protein product [Rhizophagus irregularis]
MPDEKGIKKVIGNTYNYTLPALIKKIKLEAKNVSLTTDMWTSRGGQGYIDIQKKYPNANKKDTEDSETDIKDEQEENIMLKIQLNIFI